MEGQPADRTRRHSEPTRLGVGEACGGSRAPYLRPTRAERRPPEHGPITPARAAAVAYVGALFLAAMDMQIVNVALPTLHRAFAKPLPDVQWTVLAYLIAMTLIIPAAAWLGDRIGTKPTFMVALALFTAASGLCGVAGSLTTLVAGRTLQGLGGGLLTPTAMAMLYRAYGPAHRARVARTVIIPILIAPAAAPIIGGYLTEALSWRWIFLVNLPVGLATLLFSARWLPDYAVGRCRPLDTTGLVVSALGLTTIIYAISEGSHLGWASPRILIAGGFGVAMLILLTRIFRSRPDPLLRLGLLHHPLFRATNVVNGLTTAPFVAGLYLTPIFLQSVLHQSPLTSGTTTCVEALGVAVGSQTVGRLYPRLGPRVLAAGGGILLSVFFGLCVFIRSGTDLWLIRGLMVLGGLANSAVLVSVQSAMFTTVRSDDLGDATTIAVTLRQLANALNVAMLTTVVASVGEDAAGFHAAYLVAAVITALGAFLATVLIETNDARPTMDHAHREAHPIPVSGDAPPRAACSR
jgi:EmrB/QacA subfamily drug resistance transporter